MKTSASKCICLAIIFVALFFNWGCNPAAKRSYLLVSAKTISDDTIAFEARLPVFKSGERGALDYINARIDSFVQANLSIYRSIDRDTFFNPIFFRLTYRVFRHDQDTLSFALIEDSQSGGARGRQLIHTWNYSIKERKRFFLKDILPDFDPGSKEVVDCINTYMKTKFQTDDCKVSGEDLSISEFNLYENKLWVALDNRQLRYICEVHWVEFPCSSTLQK